ncbi:MAG: hypothetical protein KC931_24950, partial [Candidatus Omnitrophica bacterium]|nr:hypothetical protein [Candidatus Omnitrophota bacterium]
PPDEGLYEFKHLPAPTGERPGERFRAEASLVQRSRRRPLSRNESGHTEMSEFFDNRGRWKVHPSANIRTRVARINLQALAETDDTLADLLDRDVSVLQEGRFPGGETCQWGKTEEGYPLLTFRDFQGNEIARFPRSFSPWSEIADHRVERPSPDPFVALLGVGLGRFIDLLAAESPDRKIYLWEPNANRMRAALGGADWTALFARPNLSWCIGQSAEQFLETIEESEPEAMRNLPVYWRPWIHPGLEIWGQKEVAPFHPAWIRFYQGLRR